MRVEFNAQVRIGDGAAVCTRNTITVDDDGTFLLHMQLMGAVSPILDLAVPPNAPVGIITAVVSALVNSTATTEYPGSSPGS